MLVQSPLKQLQYLTQGDTFIFQGSLDLWMRTDQVNTTGQVYCVRLNDGALQARGLEEGVIEITYTCIPKE